MAASQFQIYTSADANSPGYITGTTGSLITILDACLVNGYGSKPAAGWTSPIATSASVATYKQPMGAGCTLLVADYGSGSAGTKEAELVGWETASSVLQPVGTGVGQFPLPSQLLTFGEVLCRKSLTTDTVGRPWVMFADSSSFYLLIQTGDTTGLYYGVGFGDIYSLAGSTDRYRCIIIGSTTVNAPGTAAAHSLATLNFSVGSNVPGHYMPRTVSGGGASTQVGKHGDSSKAASSAADYPSAGLIQTPNAADNAYYLSPIFIHESATSTVRGRLRGVWQVCHAVTTFFDGQTFQGCGDYAGKNFQIVKNVSGAGTGYLAFETGSTVETN